MTTKKEHHTTHAHADKAPAGDVFSMSVDELTDRAKQAAGLVAQALLLLPGLVTYTKDQRKRSNGKLRGGEAGALTNALDAADKHPAYFTSLAASDGGSDAKVFETAPAREALQRAAAIAVVGDALDAFGRKVSDSSLALGELGRGVALATYEIAKVNAKNDKSLASDLAETIDFYAAKHAPKKPAPGTPPTT